MKEGMAALTNRLRREGRWDEASAWKDAQIKKHRAEGKPRSEAKELAWEALAEKYPPISDLEPVSIESTDSIDDEPLGFDFELMANSDPVDYSRDVEWVYQNLPAPNLRPEHAPSAGAFGLLQWARRNQNRFFEHVMPKAFSATARLPSGTGTGELTSEYMDDLSEVEALLRQVSDGCCPTCGKAYRKE